MMHSEMWKSLFYLLKPVVPRLLQIALRRKLALAKLGKTGECWPIDPSSAEPPEGWRGWPAGRRFALVLTHDVENERGVRRCLRLAASEQESGFRSTFNFVPEKYRFNQTLRQELEKIGFEVGVHDLRHDGRLYRSRAIFAKRAAVINRYLESWNAVGFRSASMYHQLEWIHDLRIEYDSSTFDTDPFEPQPDGMGTIFPIWIAGDSTGKGYVELPYTLPQDLTLFILLKHDDQRVWKEKLEWIAQKGGMALVNTHPDYMYWKGERPAIDEYPHDRYLAFLRYVAERYRGQYWHALPREVARYWRRRMAPRSA